MVDGTGSSAADADGAVASTPSGQRTFVRVT